MNQAIQRRPFYDFLLAARPKTLTTAIVPMIIGTVLAKDSDNPIQWGLMFFGLLAALSLQIGTNLINDALDFKKGADTETRIGPRRVTQSGLLSFRQVYVSGLLFFLLAVLFAVPLILKGGIPFLFLILFSALCGYFYTGGPVPLAYYGFGEIFVMIFYGIIATPAMYYLQTGDLQAPALLAGIQGGFLATVLIAMNNLRDHVGDAKANKKTLVVRFGVPFGRWLITGLLLAPFLLNPLWKFYGEELAVYLPYLAFPLALVIIKKMWGHPPGPLYNHFFGMCSLLHLSFGILLLLGLVIR